MRILGIIPARYASSRFPGKPLHPIAGKPLLQHVVERCQQAGSLSEVIVATDDSRIAEVAGRFCRVEMTSERHPSGTDRIAEVVERNPCDAAVNIQYMRGKRLGNVEEIRLGLPNDAHSDRRRSAVPERPSLFLWTQLDVAQIFQLHHVSRST